MIKTCNSAGDQTIFTAIFVIRFASGQSTLTDNSADRVVPNSHGNFLTLEINF
jgi:hypothetical protein